MISYYELLGMIKEGKAPNKIKAHLNSQPKIYVREDDLDDTFNYYGLVEEEKEDSSYHYYLAEDFLESSMFDENIEILDEKEIEQINKNYKIRIFDSDKPHKTDYDMEKLIEMLQDIFSKQREIIDYLNSKEYKNGKSYDER